MNKEQQREFASVQILLKRRNTDVPKLPFLDDTQDHEGPMSIEAHVNLCMLCTVCILMFKH
jgi:hypothetical protein